MTRLRICAITSLLLSGAMSAVAQPVDTAAFSDLMEKGQELYNQELYSEAQTVLEEAVALQPKSSLAHYRLGWALYQQEEAKKALKSFERAFKHDRKSADALIGIGLANLRLDRQRLDARAAFRRAQRIEPDNADIHDYLGLTYVSTFGRRREHGVDGRPHFRKAIEINPRHPNAHYHLGLTYEVSPVKNYRKAIPHYFNQLMATPDHDEALEHLAGCLMRTRRFEEGAAMMDQIAVLQGSEHNNAIQSRRAQLYALALGDVRNYGEAYTMYGKFLAGLAPSEQVLYTDLRFVVSEEMALAYQNATEHELVEIRRKFWAARDPDPSTIVNERLVEHYRRVLYARTNFAAAQFPWDRRGDIYIRYGDPDNRQNIARAFPTNNAKVDAIRELNSRLWYIPNSRGFTESWVYLPYGIELFFSDPFGNGEFDFPPLTTDPRVNRFHPDKIASDLIAKQPEGYQFDYGGEPLEFIFDAVTYRGENGSTEVELAYSILARQLGHVADGQGEHTWFNSFVVLRDKELHRITKTNVSIGPVERPAQEIPKRNAKSVVRTASLSLSAPPGTYRTAIGVRDSVSRRIGIYEWPLTIWDYSTDAINLSDIKLSLSVSPEVEDGPFVRHGNKITPNPSRLFQRAQPVFFYYEVYNLRKNESGRTAYRTDLEITMKEKKMNIIWRILSGFGMLVRNSDKENQTVLISYDGEGTRSDEYLFTSLDTGDSPAGDYTVTLTITDLSSGQTITKVKDFVISDDGRHPVLEEEKKVDMKRIVQGVP